MSTSAPRRAIALAAAAISLVVASPASATVTTTRVTAPAEGAFGIYQEAEAVVVRGTSDGTTGDAVNLICHRPDGSYYYFREAGEVVDMPVAADGTWSLTVRGNQVGQPECRLRAIPAGTSPSADALAAFAGTASWGLSYRADQDDYHPTATWRWHAYGRHTRAASRYQNFEDCGICTMGFGGFSYDRPELFPENATLATRSWVDRAAISVDGVQAFGPAAARAVHPAAPGRPSAELSVVSRGGDDVTVRESSPLARCASDTVPIQPWDCSPWNTAGVRLDRRFETSAGGRVVEIVDELVSTDGQAHEVEIDWQQAAAAVRLPGEAGFRARPVGHRPAINAADGHTIYVIGDPNAAPAWRNPVGAMTLDQPWRDMLVDSAGRYTHRTRHAVPAGGVARMRWQFVIGESLAEVDAHVRAAEQRYGLPFTRTPAPVQDVVAPPPSPSTSAAPADAAPAGSPEVSEPPRTAAPAPPRSFLTAAGKQDLAGTGTVAAKARCGETACTVDATGTVSVGGTVYSLARVQRRGDAGDAVRLSLKLGRSARAAVRRALRRGEPVTATVRVVARGADGRARTERVRVRVRGASRTR